MAGDILAYCMKCKEKQRMNSPQAVFTKKSTPATKGTCPVCGTTMFRMGKTPAHARAAARPNRG